MKLWVVLIEQQLFHGYKGSPSLIEEHPAEKAFVEKVVPCRAIKDQKQQKFQTLREKGSLGFRVPSVAA